MSVLLAALSALFYGAADFSGGFATRRSSVFSVMVASQTAGLALAVCLSLGAPFPGPADLAWSLAAGLGGVLGLLFLYRGIANCLVAVVSPVSALVGPLFPVALGLASGEAPPPAAALGAALCFPALLLLSWEKGLLSRATASGSRLLRASLVHGLLAGAGFGCFFMAVSRVGKDTGLWPLAVARVSSIATVAAFCLLSGKRLALARGSRLVTFGAGLADMLANAFFLLSARSGYLALAAVVSSLFPAPTVLLARVFMKERIPPLRLAGLALAVAGVALMSL